MSGDKVRHHYGRGGLGDRILEALRSAGKNVESLSPADLAPLDHFHSRGKAATDELFEASGFRAGMRVLDVGSGIGGPARYLADKGIKVTGIDLTAEFCEVARDLTRRSGLGDMAEFHQGSALDLPFQDACFDGAWLQHVNMNIADKSRLASELARVVIKGGRVALHEVFSGNTGEVLLPVPWASSREESHLVPPSQFRGELESAGLEVTYWKDDTEASARFFHSLFEKMRATGLPPLSLHLLFGDDFEPAFRNYARALDERRCSVIQAIAQRTG